MNKVDYVLQFQQSVLILQNVKWLCKRASEGYSTHCTVINVHMDLYVTIIHIWPNDQNV